MINVFMNLLDLTLAGHSMRLGLMYVYMNLLLLSKLYF